METFLRHIPNAKKRGDDDEDIGGNDCDKVDIVCKVVGRLVNVFANHFASTV